MALQLTASHTLPLLEYPCLLYTSGDDQLLDVREFATAEEARGSLEAGDVVGVLSVDGEGAPHLAVSPVSDGVGTKQIGRTILNTVADTYVRNADLLKGIAHDNPMALADPDLVERALSQGCLLYTSRCV